MSESRLARIRKAVEAIPAVAHGEGRDQAIREALEAIHEALQAQEREITLLRDELDRGSGPGSTGRTGDD